MERRGSSKVPTSSGVNAQRLPVACVYFKNDPKRYQRCGRHAFPKISCMKQHIRRRHLGPEYHCSHCGAAFEDLQRRQNHITTGQCPGRPQTELDEMRMKLSKHSKPRLPFAEQWLAIFDIVCPGHPHPLSPFHDSEVSDVASSGFLEFLTGHTGIELVLESARQRSDWRPENEAPLREALSHGLPAAFDKWSTLKSGIPENVVSEDAPEASSSSIPNPSNSWDSGPSNCLSDYPVLESERSIEPAQPSSAAHQDASYNFELPDTSKSVQTSGTSSVPVEDDSHDRNLANSTMLNMDVMTDPMFTFDDLALLEDLFNGGGGQPSTYDYDF